MVAHIMVGHIMDAHIMRQSRGKRNHLDARVKRNCIIEYIFMCITQSHINTKTLKHPRRKITGY